jgi:hypothetical protein
MNTSTSLRLYSIDWFKPHDIGLINRYSNKLMQRFPDLQNISQVDGTSKSWKLRLQFGRLLAQPSLPNALFTGPQPQLFPYVSELQCQLSHYA